jgi:hypothetical protein
MADSDHLIVMFTGGYTNMPPLPRRATGPYTPD